MRSETALPHTDRNDGSQASGLMDKDHLKGMRDTFFMTGVQFGSTVSEFPKSTEAVNPMFRSTLKDFKLNQTINR